MKASELMIGDYCMCGDILVKVSRVSEESASGIDLDALTPIPITKEFIEANGWPTSKREVGGMYFDNVFSVGSLEFCWSNDTNRLYEVFNDGEFWIDDIKYVHQFQNKVRCSYYDQEEADNIKLK